GTEGATTIALTTGSPGKAEVCDNGIDDDGNGVVDCQDAACVTAPSCAASECSPDVSVGALVVGAPSKNVTVDTATSANRYHPPCAGTSKGNDRAIAFSLPEAGGVRVVFQNDGDHTFSIFKMAAAGQACDDDTNLVTCADLGQSAGDFAQDGLPAGKYLLIAKAVSPALQGRLSLQMSAFANRKVETCNNGFDDDGNGLADCQDPACAGVGGCKTIGCATA